MDPLSEVIEVLAPIQRKEFERYLSIHGKKADRRDGEMFRLICEDPSISSDQLLKELYPDNNRNAYHTLRKRLFARLQEFISIKLIETDASPAGSVAVMINTAQFFIENEKFNLAARFLSKAKWKAKKHRLFSQHAEVLKLSMNHAMQLKFDYEVLFQEWSEIKKLNELEENVSLATTLIRSQLDQLKRSGESIVLKEIAQRVLAKLGVNSDDIYDAGIAYRLMEIFRSSMIATKEYDLFESYVEQQFEKLRDANSFSENDIQYELGFLYMIAHAKYRNRKLDEADVVNKEMRLKAEGAGDKLKRDYFAKYKMMKASIETYSGNNELAITLLEEELINPSKLRLEDRLNMMLNLSVYYFQADMFEEALARIQGMEMNERKLQRIMGKEWRFKKALIEIIILIELGEIAKAKLRMRALDRTFSDFLKLRIYERVNGFLKVIRWIMDNPTEVASAHFEEKVDSIIERLPGDREDIQAMTFYCWVKSKMIQRPYYEVLVETIQTFE